jgi:hypothetical protein
MIIFLPHLMPWPLQIKHSHTITQGSIIVNNKDNITGNWDGSVSVATGYRLNGQGSIPGRGKIFILCIASTVAVEHTQPPIQWVFGAISPGVKQPGHEADHSPLSSAEVKNGQAIPVFPHMTSWHSTELIKHRGDFTFTFYYIISPVQWKGLALSNGPSRISAVLPFTWGQKQIQFLKHALENSKWWI